jgi:four helix bundle protein
MSRETCSSNAGPLNVKRKTLNGTSAGKRFGHEQLDLFKVARQLAIEMYKETAHFPAEERFGLSSQIRRSAVSIPANIAEGAARRSKREFARFLLNARGSSTELRLLLEIATETGILDEDRHRRHDAALNRVFSMLNGLLKNVEVPA